MARNRSRGRSYATRTVLIGRDLAFHHHSHIGTAAAQTPFVGTWKLNQDKSQLAGDTMKFGPAQGDAIELKAGGLTYSFRVDGKNYAMPSGNIAIWRQTSPTSWTTEYRKADGSLLSRDRGSSPRMARSSL